MEIFEAVLNHLLNNIWDIVGVALAIVGIVLAIKYGNKKRKTKLTWTNSMRTAENLLEKIEKSDWKPDVVIGVGRSGGIWGGWLAGNLGSLPFAVVDNVYNKDGKAVIVSFTLIRPTITHYKNEFGENFRLLLVTGGSSTGNTLNAVVKQFETFAKNCDVKTAALYQHSITRAEVDFVGMAGLEPWPVKFPWHLRTSYTTYFGDMPN